MATELVDAGSPTTEQGLVPEQAAVVVQTEPEGHAEEEKPSAKQEPDAVVTEAVDNRRFKYNRDEMLRFGKATGNSVFPSGLELVGPELRDLDKRVPYERGLTREASLDTAGDAGPALKPSWAIGRFGQANKQAADGVAAAKPPPPGFGLPANPIRSRLLEENTFRDDEPQQRGLGLGRLGNGAPAPWRGHDKEVDRDRERARDRPAREPWAIESPPEKGRADNDLFKASPPEGRRAPSDRWEKPGDTWRGGGAAQQPAPAKEPWRGGAADRWGGAGDERATARDTHTRRPGGGWGDESHGDRRRNDRQDAGDEDDGGIGDPHRAKGRGRGMTAAEMEAERLAFRKQLEADKQRKADKPGLRGIYEHEEVDLNDLMDDTQKGVAVPSSAPAAAVAGPPGFARPGYGVKMSFEQLAKAAASGEAPAPAAAPAQQQQPAKVGIALDELEKQLNVGPVRGGFVAPLAAQGAGDQGAPGGAFAAPPGAAPAGTFGFKADTNASMALLGMLNRGPGGQNGQGGQGTPAALEGNGMSAPAPPGPAQAPPLGDAGDAGAKPFAALGLGALGGGNKIPASVLNAFGEGAVKEAYAAFPSLSSIWGAPAMGSGSLPPAPLPPAELPAGPTSQHGMPPSTQAAAAALFEQLSNAAAAGSTARPPAPGAMQQQQQVGHQQQQPLPQQQQQQASNAIMALLGKQAGQQQQPGAPRDAGLNALMAQYGRTGPQTGPPRGPAGAEAGGSSTPLADDNFNSMFKDLGISPEPPRPKEQANQPLAGTGAGIPGWPQQARPGVNPSQQHLPGQGGNQLTAKAVQELLAAAGTGQQRVGQSQQSSMQQLQQLLVNGQQQLNLQAALQQQQLHQQQLQQQPQPQQQQWASNMLHAMQQQVAMRPGMGQQQQQQQQPGGYPANLMQQQQQQMLQQQMQQRMQQQQQATQQANMAAVMQAAQQQRPQQGGFDPALLARLQGAMGLGGGAAPGQAHQQGHLQGMAANPGGNPLASALGIQHMMQMQQQLHAARTGTPQSGGMGGQAPAQAQHDPNNLARFFNAAALQQAQASALRQPQGAAMPTVADLERILGQRR